VARDPPAVVAAPDREGVSDRHGDDQAGATRAEVTGVAEVQGAAEYMAPALVLVLETMPMLGSGKTDYIELADRARQARLRRTAARRASGHGRQRQRGVGCAANAAG